VTSSPDDLQCQLRRATARDEICDLVPVHEAGECIGKRSPHTETPQLLGTPFVDEDILVVVLVGGGHQHGFHRSVLQDLG
jgi:hypothetical protein